MKREEDVRSIVNALKQLYPDALCSLQYDKDYELLFAVRLSAQCTDERVNKVTPALFERFPTLEAFAEADPAEVAKTSTPAASSTAKAGIWWAALRCCSGTTAARCPLEWKICSSCPALAAKLPT